MSLAATRVVLLAPSQPLTSIPLPLERMLVSGRSNKTVKKVVLHLLYLPLLNFTVNRDNATSLIVLSLLCSPCKSKCKLTRCRCRDIKVGSRRWTSRDDSSQSNKSVDGSPTSNTNTAQSIFEVRARRHYLILCRFPEPRISLKSSVR
jgi:hypothetical protein